MASNDLQTLRSELPELFQTGTRLAEWREEAIIVEIRDPEGGFEDDSQRASEVSENWLAEDSKRLEERCCDFIDDSPGPPTIDPWMIESLAGKHAGSLQTFHGGPYVPPPDSLAFYLPFHFYYPSQWGVYLLLDGVIWVASEVIRRSNGKVGKLQAMRAARLSLYYHEAFHHKTECFATRLELTHRQPFYKDACMNLYAQTVGTNACLEEGLAEAFSLRSGKKRHRSPVIDQALVEYARESPPGYCRGPDIRGAFFKHQCEFAEQNQRICLPHLRQTSPEVWRSVPYMFNGFANIKSKTNYLILKNSRIAERLQLRGDLRDRTP